MPFYQPNSRLITVSIFPHVFSRLDPVTKRVYRDKYKKVKVYGSASVMAGVGLTEGTQLAKDIINSKLKAHGYKSQ